MPRWGLTAMIVMLGAMPIGPNMPTLADGHNKTSDSVPFGQPRPGSLDDGWRRTVDGWEHVGHWQALGATFHKATDVEPPPTIPSSDHLAIVPGRRLDFHPAALALLQVTVLVCLTVFLSTPARA